jgi:hypothetical protein
VEDNRLRNAIIGVIVACPLAIGYLLLLSQLNLSRPSHVSPSGATQWPFNPVLAFICLYFLSITIAVPVTLIAWAKRRRRDVIALPSIRQRFVDVSIFMLAASAVLGWGMFAFTASGAAAKFGIDIEYNSFVIGVAFVPPVLALLSGILAVIGRGAGRAAVLIGFVLILLGMAVMIPFLIDSHNAPPLSF